MDNAKKSFLTNLTTAEMKKLLAARERLDVLLAEKRTLTRSLDRIEVELSKLLDSAGKAKPKSPGRKKPGPKKNVGRKKAGKKVTRRAQAKSSGRIKLEDVIVKVIKANKGPMSYKKLMGVIVKKKLFDSKSANFDNVLRRTLSTSKLVKRVGRGIYSVA